MSVSKKSAEQKALEMLKNKSVSQYDFVVLTECLRFKDRGQDAVKNKEVILATGLDQQIIAKSLNSLADKKILFKIDRGLFSLKSPAKKDPAKRLALVADIKAAKELYDQAKKSLSDYDVAG